MSLVFSSSSYRLFCPLNCSGFPQSQSCVASAGSGRGPPNFHGRPHLVRSLKFHRAHPTHPLNLNSSHPLNLYFYRRHHLVRSQLNSVLIPLFKFGIAASQTGFCKDTDGHRTLHVGKLALCSMCLFPASNIFLFLDFFVKDLHFIQCCICCEFECGRV